MGEKEKAAGLLAPYRVLDLTDEKGLLCGKILGDLGADVIKVEKPGGDPARRIGPFYRDEVDPEKSLFWWALNTSKRGITLDIETAQGRKTFRKLVRTADLVLESFSPGYLDSLGLGYSALEKVHPGVILVSISAFGQTGPYKDYQAPDIVAWAMGGRMYPCGDEDRPPLRIGHHSQAHLHAAGQAAAGAVMALYHRQITGHGQTVDVSIEELVAQDTYLPMSCWDMVGEIARRGGTSIFPVRLTRIWPCRDGYVMWVFSGGTGGNNRCRPMVRMMDEAGMATDFLRQFDWEAFDLVALATASREEAEKAQATIDRMEEPAGRFFLSRTRAQLYQEALKHRALLYPVATVADLLADVQLATRGFWVEMEHPELGTTVTYPGAFAHTSETWPGISRRAPLIGEHNREILEIELGAPEEQAGRPQTLSANPTRVGSKGQPRKNAHKPLGGIRVVDFTWNIVGPLISKTLADYGAEVIRIEHESRPDPMRASAYPFKDHVPGLNRSGIFNKWNTGKRSVAINLTVPGAVAVVKRLIARSDIVLESFAGGVITNLGLGYEALKHIKPDIIMLGSCMMGQTGPHATHPGYGWMLSAMAGYFHITGWPDRAPTAPEGPYTDFIAPRFGLSILLAALDYRRRTGRGQYIDLAQYETGVHFMAPLILDYMVNRRVADRMGNRHTEAAPHGVYPCRGDDRWCAIAVFGENQWRSFRKAIGNPDWAESPLFDTLEARKQNEDALDSLVAQWTAGRTAEEVMHTLQAAGVAAGVVQTGQDLLEHDPQLRHRRSFQVVHHPEIGRHYAPGPSFVLSECPYELRRAPLLGEDNEYVLREVLGMGDEEIAELVVAGAVG